VASVSLLSFSSGLPLGLVWFAVPTWMATAGVDIRLIGLFTLAQAPWTFKVLWAPLMDRFQPPFLGRKRGFILLAQLALGAGIGALALAGDAAPERVLLLGAITVAIAVAAATQDVAIDGYAVEVLRPGEHGLAVGARTALYRAAMAVAGTLTITLASPGWLGSWSMVLLGLAALYLPLALVTALAPEPVGLPEPPASMRAAIGEPLRGFLAQPRALEILAFVVLFKLTDSLSQALTRPFLVQVGFSGTHVGVGSGAAELVAVMAGTMIGGLLTDAVGLGRALWITGGLQMFSNLGYAAVAEAGPVPAVLYAAVGFEMFTSGLGTGAFGVLLLRLTQKRFSATQYALLSSLFALPRTLAGPLAGLLVAHLGWTTFFVLTVLAGIPGLLMLARFVPWGVRDPHFDPERGGLVRGAPAG
jgi:PAT family beta-lactamase induction signal transducer AmpG